MVVKFRVMSRKSLSLLTNQVVDWDLVKDISTGTYGKLLSADLKSKIVFVEWSKPVCGHYIGESSLPEIEIPRKIVASTDVRIENTFSNEAQGIETYEGIVNVDEVEYEWVATKLPTGKIVIGEKPDDFKEKIKDEDSIREIEESILEFLSQQKETTQKKIKETQKKKQAPHKAYGFGYEGEALIEGKIRPFRVWTHTAMGVRLKLTDTNEELSFVNPSTLEKWEYLAKRKKAEAYLLDAQFLIQRRGFKRNAFIMDVIKKVVDLVSPFASWFISNPKLRTALNLLVEVLKETKS